MNCILQYKLVQGRKVVAYRFCDTMDNWYYDMPASVFKEEVSVAGNNNSVFLFTKGSQMAKLLYQDSACGSNFLQLYVPREPTVLEPLKVIVDGKRFLTEADVAAKNSGRSMAKTFGNYKVYGISAAPLDDMRKLYTQFASITSRKNILGFATYWAHLDGRNLGEFYWSDASIRFMVELRGASRNADVDALALNLTDYFHNETGCYVSVSHSYNDNFEIYVYYR